MSNEEIKTRTAVENALNVLRGHRIPADCLGNNTTGYIGYIQRGRRYYVPEDCKHEIINAGLQII